MKRTFLIVALVIGLALGLSVAVGVAWFFLWQSKAGPTAIQTGPNTDPTDTGAAGAGGTPGGNNTRATKFAELDTDQDGQLSLSEFSRGREVV
jgi:hypothetical protein